MKSLFILTSALLFTANVLAENDPLCISVSCIFTSFTPHFEFVKIEINY